MVFTIDRLISPCLKNLDYLFARPEGQSHCGHFNQYGVPKNFWKAVLQHNDESKANYPSLYDEPGSIRALKEQGRI